MAKEMTAKIEGKELVLRIPLGKGRPSGSGKNTVVFTTGGNKKIGVKHNGHELTVGMNIYHPAEDGDE